MNQVIRTTATTALLLSSFHVVASDTFVPFIDPMTSTKWGQGAPYNQSLPTLDGQHTYPGFAVAQILKFHEYTKQGRGEVTY